jgi:predicted amidohydrolase YtcJ
MATARFDAGIQAARPDFSPGPLDPRMSIQGMTRTVERGNLGSQTRVTVEEALRISTINGAQQFTRRKNKDHY